MLGIALVEEMIKKSDVEIVYGVVRENCTKLNILRKYTKLKIIACNLEEYENLPRLINDTCDTIYHLAWQGTGRKEVRNSSSMVQAENIRYTLLTLDVAVKLGCKTYIGVGSQAEYGLKDIEVIGPEIPCDPIEMYGIAKYAAGKLVRAQAEKYGVNCFWVRVFSVFGRYDSPTTMISSTVHKLLHGEVPSFTPAEQVWDYLYSKDAAEALYLIGEQEGNKVYCLGGGKARRLREYIEEIRDIINPELKLGIGDLPYPDKAVMKLCADIKSLTIDTGWNPKYEFADAIRELLQCSDV